MPMAPLSLCSQLWGKRRKTDES